MKKRFLSLLLCAALFAGLIPAAAVPAMAAALSGEETISDQYISATVSKKNGGFIIQTVEGDRLKKSDNDKDLLYHDGQYDTSFLSFRVGEGESAKEYLFGGKYADSSKVAVTKSTAGDSITAVWSVDDLTFTQTLSLTNESSNEHGMISISVTVQNSGAARKVQARLLLDTCLGSKDYGYYQFVNDQQQKSTVSQEKIIEGADVPTQLYAADDPYSPSVMAYTVHTGEKPTKVAFGHWSHLASSLFEFTANESLGFTNSLSEYMTADSAYALYYDLGSVAQNGEASLNTFYGVFSNLRTPASDAVAVNVTAPVRLELSVDSPDFIPLVNKGQADFSVTVDFSNIDKEGAQDLSHVKLAVQSTGNLRSLDNAGEAATGQDFNSTDPYVFDYADLKVGESRSKTLYFEANLSDEARYERITIGVYNNEVTAENKLGEKTVYILLPGRGGDIPEVSFAAMTPKIIYNEGTRHLFVTVTNPTMLDNRGNWKMVAYSVEEEGETPDSVIIDSNTITIDGDGVMDIPITETMKTGDWYLQLEWTDAAVSSGLVPREHQNQTAPELQFTVSDDFKYRNDGYGILAVVEYHITGSKNMRYVIKPFASQEEFDNFKEKRESNPETSDGTDYTEIVLTFKGSFTVTKKNSETGEAVCYTAVSKKTAQSDGIYKVENPIVINDCLDFEGGTVSVYYEDNVTPSTMAGITRGYSSAVCTEFDGELYTSGARTEVWKGKAVLTKLMQDYGNYSLAVYDEDGNRGYLTPNSQAAYGRFEDSETGFEEQGNEGIYLIWPSGGEIGRKLAGMLFNLTYGQFGTMYDTDSYGMAEEIVGNVISFAASLDLDFLQGETNNTETEPDTYWSKLKDIWTWEFKTGALIPYENYDEWMRLSDAYDWSTIDESGENKNEMKISGSVMVRDVIFGCGEGFVGVNFSVGATVKNYITGLPELDATISINTVNNWAFGVEGTMELADFKLEANISFKSRNNIPVPDELSFFIGGFEPGWNIDGMAVVWITGGGGGIENIYDSIFCTGAVPPLKLLLSVSFDVLKVLSCERATLAVGLTGVSLDAENIGVKKVPGLTAFEKIGLSLEWYPGIDMRASIRVNLFQGVVKGGGYLVLISPDYQDVFFEIFARCTLNVPASIPVVGGMTVAGADLGINSDRVWGAIDVMGITLGVTYYWGEGSVDFSSGSKAHPTFPSLLMGYDDIPVGYDEENDRTLYLRVGTNTRLLASSLPDDGSLVLMANSGATVKYETNTKDKWQFNLGTYSGTNSIVQITFDATSLENAKSKAQSSINVGSTDGGNDFGLILYNGSNLTEANANLTYDEATGQATYAFTVTDPDDYDQLWYMTTPAGSDVMLYGVNETPKVSRVSGSVSGSSIDLTWDGNALSELDQISFYLCESKDPEATGHRIGTVSNSTTLGSKQTSLTIPADVPSGEYYIRAVYSKADEVNGVVFSSGTVNWTNANTPGTVTITNPHAAGNLQYQLTLSEDANTDGYLVTIYDEDGNATDFEQVSFEAAETGTTTINVGGSYQTNGTTFGLTGGKSYVIGVTPYKKVTTNINGTTGEIAVRGKEVKTGAIYLPAMVTPTVTFTADGTTAQTRTTQEWGLTESGTAGMVDVTKTVYTTDKITFTATVSEAVTGTWLLDDSVLANVGQPVSTGAPGENAAALNKDQGDTFDRTASISIPLTGLADGEHTIAMSGKAADGDSFYTTYSFVVDTQPPQLLLSSPVNGSFFNKDGTVTITGITDPDARFTITCDGAAVRSNVTVADMGGTMEQSTGKFSVTLTLPDPHSASQHTLSISVSDDVGNATTPQTLTLSHGGLADLASLEVMVGSGYYPDGNIPIPASGLVGAELKLVGVTKSTDPTTGEPIKFIITGDNVYWDILTVEGSASVTDGKLTAAAFSQGIITGKLAVATNAYRTASLCFGAPGEHTVSVSSTIGGSVTGGGVYQPGSKVTLAAIPDSGYRFAGWTILGVDVSDLSASTITFTMPQSGNVTAEARFEPITSGDPGTSGTTGSITAQAGQLVQVTLPAGKSEADYLPYYLDENGEKVFVPISAVVDGRVRFIAPRTGRYYFGTNDVAFTDIAGRWSEQSILFAARRGIFNGIGGGAFAPEGVMDRAMVVAVLYRLAGSPAVNGSSGYTDVADGRWYSDAVTWGKSTGIVNGYGDGTFGVSDPITREQLCAMITRFLAYMGYDLSETADGTAFTDANDISTWAAETVTYCQTRGLVNGIPGGAFAPQAGTTREQCCAVIERLIRAALNAN